MPTTEHTELADYVASLGLTYSARFVPQSLSRNRQETTKSLNWFVTIERNGHKLETDYMQGVGFIPGRPQNFERSIFGRDAQKAFDDASELGTYPRVMPRRDFVHVPRVTLPAPNVLDVLHSLTLDASTADATFEEWCADYGVDPDSRKGEAMYRAGVDIGIKLRRILGAETLARLSKLFQDY